jgi:preprotein translocase subunit SecA
MRLFGSDKLIGWMNKLGLEEGQVIEHPWVSRSIEIAQRRVEQHNFEIRKQLLEYDNVMSKQREIIYGQRRETLEGRSLKEDILEMAAKNIDDTVSLHIGDTLKAEPDTAGMLAAVKLRFGLDVEGMDVKDWDKEKIKEEFCDRLRQVYEEKEKALGSELMRHLERMVFLQIIDSKWKDHLYAMDSLREGIGLRAYGQRDPLLEYKREAFDMFGQMVSSIEEEAVEAVFKLQPARPERFRGVFSSVSQSLLHPEAAKFERPQPDSPEEEGTSVPVKSSPKPVESTHPKVGRNDPCPCGSGKKYKKCCGAA